MVTSYEKLSAMILMASPDFSLLKTIAIKLRKWGLNRTIIGEIENIPPSYLAERQLDIVFVDIRQNVQATLCWLKTVKTLLPDVELLIINKAGHIENSIQGMRAGASDELVMPLDCADLYKKIRAAIARRNSLSDKIHKKSFLQRFQDNMSAAAFAQAGEFESAFEMLEQDNQKDKF